MLRLAALCHNRINKLNDLLIHLMSLEDRLNHYLFRNFLCPGFDHNYLFSGGRHCQSHIRILLLLIGRIHNKLSVDHADLRRGTGTVERNVRNAGRNGRT